MKDYSLIATVGSARTQIEGTYVANAHVLVNERLLAYSNGEIGKDASRRNICGKRTSFRE